MHDNAPGHKENQTQTEIKKHHMSMIPWPSYSPDLNLIEKVWDLTKDYIEDVFPEHMIYTQLKTTVQEA